MKKPKIMIIDDNKLILEITGDYFENAGFEVVKRDQALGAAVAIIDERPDCVLLDINMPAISGAEIMKLIKKHYEKEIKVFFYSEQEESALKKLVEETGADGYFRKSHKREEVLAVVREAIAPWTRV